MEMKIKTFRELRNYKQEYIAKKLAISQSHYNRIEYGQSKLTFDRLEKIAKILDISPSELITFNKKQIFNQNAYKEIRNNVNSTTHEPEVYKRISRMEFKITELERILNKISQAEE